MPETGASGCQGPDVAEPDDRRSSGAAARAGGEREMLLIFGGGLFLVTFGCFLGQNAALAIVLERDGAGALPRLYIVNAAALALMSLVTACVLPRLPSRSVLIAFFALGAVGVEAVRWAHSAGLGWAPGAMYVTAFALTDLSVALFWSLANWVYDTRDAKRLFPRVGAAGTLGGALAGFSARALVGGFGTAALFDVWAALLVGCAIWSHMAARMAGDPGGGRRPRAPAVASVPGPTYRPLWWAILAGLVCVVTVTLFGRYVYGRALEQAYPNAEDLAAINGLLIGVGSLLTFLAQALVTSRLLLRFGAGVAGLVYPLAMAAVFAAMYRWFGLAAAVFCFFGITAIRQGIQGAVENVLYNPLGPEAAARALVFMAAAGMPLGMVCAGVGLELLKDLPPATAALAGLAVSGLLLAAAMVRSRAYRGALRRCLARGGSDVRMRFGALLDESNATVESILAEGMEPDAPDLLERLRTLVRAHAREEAAAGVAGRGASPAGWDASGPLGRIVDARLKESYVLSIALRRLPRPDAPAEVDDLWRGAIRNRLGENVAVVLAGLRAATHAPDFDRISLRVFDADRRVRAAAVDILDEICPDEIRALVLPLLEEEHMSEGERAARRRYGDLGGADPVAALFEIPDDWVRACTAYAVAHLTPSRYVGQLKAHEASADRFLAFSAAYALGRT